MDPVTDPAATPNPADPNLAPVVDPNKETSLLDGAGQPKKDDSILDEAAQKAKTDQEAADTALLTKEDKDCTPEELTKKTELKEAKAKKESDVDKGKAPEKYEFKVPEGMTLNQALADKVSPILKTMNLSQENAQKLMDVYVEQLKVDEDVKAADFKKFVDDSKQETIKDLGANYQTEMAFAAKVRTRFLSEATIELLNASGLSNNVSFIKDLIGIGKQVSEDILVEGKEASGGAEKSAAEKMYPNQGK